MIKPYKIVDSKDVESIDNLFSILFRQGQGKEFRSLKRTGTGVWITADMIEEKEIVLVKNVTHNILRLYTKFEGELKYIQFS